MADAVFARTYEGSVDNSFEEANYTSAVSLVETGQQVQLAVFKAATVEVEASCYTKPVDLTTSQSLSLGVTKSSDKIAVHFNLVTSVNVTFKDASGVAQNFTANVAITGDFTVKYTQENYCDAMKSCCEQLQTSCGYQVQNACGGDKYSCGPDGKIVISCGSLDLSATTSLFFTDGSSTGNGALILNHNQVTSFASAVVSDGDSSADAAATIVGALGLAVAFLNQGSDPFSGYTGYDILMLKALGLDAAVISADPSAATAQTATVLTTFLGAGLALDYAIRALAVADAQPTELALNSNSDSGVKGDRITSDRTVQIDGKTGACDAITLYDGTKAVGSGYADTKGVFHVTTTALSDGVHNLVAVATDGNGYKVSSEAFTITIDSKAPNDPLVTDLSAAGLSGTAEAGSKVAIYDVGRLVGTVTAGADGHWTLARAITDTSTHSYTLTSTDAAGNSTSSDGAAMIRQATSGTVTGTAGDDFLVARGTEVLTGGGGHDRFVFDMGSGKATISDYTDGVDKIEIDHALAGSFAALKLTKSGTSDVLVTIDATHTILLKSVTLSSLTSSDFIFT